MEEIKLKLIKYGGSRVEFVGEITRAWDNCIKGTPIKKKRFHRSICTYIYADPDERIFDKEENYLAVRFPGATRGYLTVNKDGIIIGYKVYTDISLLYNLDKIDKKMKYFMGKKLVFTDECEDFGEEEK